MSEQGNNVRMDIINQLVQARNTVRDIRRLLPPSCDLDKTLLAAELSIEVTWSMLETVSAHAPLDSEREQ